MSPAAALALLRAAPDVRLIKRLIFLNHDHEEQRWLRHTTGKPLVIRAETMRTRGEITLFRPHADPFADFTLRHEWGHLLAYDKIEAWQWFEWATPSRL